MDSSQITDLQNRITELKERQIQSFNKLSVELSKLNDEHSKEVLPIYADIKQMQLMVESGNIDEKVIEQIKSKYGTETHK